MKPLLAHVYEPHRVTFPCYVQPKLNGIRALYQAGHFQSRDELPFPPDLLDHLAKPLFEIFGPEVILDGELYKHGWPLQRINAAVTPVRLKPTEDTLQVEYHVFDVVDYTKPFHERCFKPKLQWPTIVQTFVAYEQEDADVAYAHFVSLGYEGMMYRLGDCPYTIPKQDHIPLELEWPTFTKTRYLSDKNNRCWHLLKRKDWQDDEFEIVAVNEGEGKNYNMTGSFSYRYKDGRDLFDKDGKRPTVGSGITDAERQHYWNVPPIKRLIKIKYLVLSSDGIPLNPTIITIL